MFLLDREPGRTIAAVSYTVLVIVVTFAVTLHFQPAKPLAPLSSRAASGPQCTNGYELLADAMGQPWCAKEVIRPEFK